MHSENVFLFFDWLKDSADSIMLCVCTKARQRFQGEKWEALVQTIGKTPLLLLFTPEPSDGKHQIDQIESAEDKT